MRPEKVLELMHSALQRYETVRAAPRHRGDGPTLTDFDALNVEEIFFDEPFSDNVFTSHDVLPWR